MSLDEEHALALFKEIHALSAAITVMDNLSMTPDQLEVWRKAQDRLLYLVEQLVK